MRSFLSIFVERFGKYSSCRLNLLDLDSLEDIDTCTKMFSNAKEMRKSFNDKIEEFNDKFEPKLNAWKRMYPGKTNNGRIYANYLTSIDNTTFIATVPIMYKGDELIPFEEAREHIAYYLNNAKTFAKLFKYKSYLLRENEEYFEYAKDCIKNPQDEVLRREVINNLIHRINVMDEENRYLYLRSLMNLCHLTKHEIFLQSGKIGNISNQIPVNTASLQSKPNFYGNDFYFDELIDREDDEELYNLYSLEEIEKKKRGR